MGEFCGLSKVSFSMAVLASVSECSENVTKDKNPDGCELFGTRLVAAAVFLIMPLIALVEGIVRGFFAIFATLIALCIPEDECRDWYNEHIFTPLAGGSVLSFVMAISSPIAFGYNFKKELTNADVDAAFALVKPTFEALGLNDKSFKSMPGPCCAATAE